MLPALSRVVMLVGCALCVADRAHGLQSLRTREPRNRTFTIVTAFGLETDWLQSNTALLGLNVGFRAMSTYSLLHDYTFRPVFVSAADSHISWSRVFLTDSMFQPTNGNGRPLSCPSDWVVWMESDTWITNNTVTLDSIVDLAVGENGEEPDVIVNRDYIGNINTGVTLVRCSKIGKAAMDALIRCKSTHKDHDYVKWWDHNGCMMILHGQAYWKKHISFVPAKNINAYPAINMDTGVVVACKNDECENGIWAPGDFLVHFAGMDKGRAMQWFLDAFPQDQWGTIDPNQYPASAVPVVPVHDVE